MNDPLHKKTEEIEKLTHSIKQSLQEADEYEWDVEKIIKLSLAAGVGALVIYWILRKLLGSGGKSEEPKQKSRKKKKNDNYISKLIAEQIGIILLTAFRKKILQALEKYTAVDEKKDS